MSTTSDQRVELAAAEAEELLEFLELRAALQRVGEVIHEAPASPRIAAVLQAMLRRSPNLANEIRNMLEPLAPRLGPEGQAVLAQARLGLLDPPGGIDTGVGAAPRNGLEREAHTEGSSAERSTLTGRSDDGTGRFVGRVVGPYRLERPLFDTSAATFYATTHLVSGEPRTARVEWVAPQNQHRRRSEIEASAELIHRSIPATHHVDLVDGMLVTITDPFEARPPRERRAGLALTPTHAASIVTAMAAAIDAAHAHGLCNGRIWLEADGRPILFDAVPIVGPISPDRRRVFSRELLDWIDGAGDSRLDPRAADIDALEAIGWWLLTGQDGARNASPGLGAPRRILAHVEAVLDRTCSSAGAFALAFAMAIDQALPSLDSTDDEQTRVGWNDGPGPDRATFWGGAEGATADPLTRESPFATPDRALASPRWPAADEAPTLVRDQSLRETLPPSSPAPLLTVTVSTRRGRRHLLAGGILGVSVLVIAVLTAWLSLPAEPPPPAALAAPTLQSAPSLVFVPTRQPEAAATTPTGARAVSTLTERERDELEVAGIIVAASVIAYPPTLDPDRAIAQLEGVEGRLAQESPRRTEILMLKAQIWIDDANRRVEIGRTTNQPAVLDQAQERFENARATGWADEQSIADGLKQLQIARLWLAFEGAYAEQDLGGQLDALQRIYARDPDSRGPNGTVQYKLYNAMISRAELLMSEGELDEAFKQLEQAEQLDPSRSEARELRLAWTPTPTPVPAAPSPSQPQPKPQPQPRPPPPLVPPPPKPEPPAPDPGNRTIRMPGRPV